jgi:hypothetical protein
MSEKFTLSQDTKTFNFYANSAVRNYKITNHPFSNILNSDFIHWLFGNPLHLQEEQQEPSR